MTALRMPHDTLVLVADGEKALVLRNAGDEIRPNLKVERLFEQVDPPTREQGTDRPGRVHDSGGTHKSAVAGTDWHRLEKVSFAKTVAEALHRSAQAGAFDKLVVVAPPLILHTLRTAFHQDVKSRIIAEIDKDLTNHPVDAIERALTAA